MLSVGKREFFVIKSCVLLRIIVFFEVVWGFWGREMIKGVVGDKGVGKELFVYL